MSTIMKSQKTFFEKVIFAISVALFGLLNLIPGLITGSPYADAQHGGGGGGGSNCPGTTCTGQGKLCCTKTVKCSDFSCTTVTYYYYYK